MILWPRLRRVLDPIEMVGRFMFGAAWIGDQYVDRFDERRAEAFTQRELDGGCVVPWFDDNGKRHLTRITSSAESRAAFWAEYDRRQAEKDRRPARMLRWGRG